MAIHNNHVSGAIGPVIFYTRNGKQCCRSKPRKVKQTIATKKRSSNFSIASKFSAAARRSMKDLCKLPDGTRHNRLTKTFSLWLRTADVNSISTGVVSVLQELSLNPEKNSTGKWNNHISMALYSEGIKIKVSDLIPCEMIAMPRNTSITRITFASSVISAIDFKSASSVNVFTLPNNERFSGTDIDHILPVMPRSIILSGYAIECFDKNMQLLKWRKGFHPPATICFAYWKA